jgi:hypothetical protein
MTELGSELIVVDVIVHVVLLLASVVAAWAATSAGLDAASGVPPLLGGTRRPN